MTKPQIRRVLLAYRASLLHYDQLMAFDLSEADEIRMQEVKDELVEADMKRARIHSTTTDACEIVASIMLEPK